VKSVDRAISVQVWLTRIEHLVIVVAELVMNDTKVLVIDLHAHLDADILGRVPTPRTGVAHDLTIGRLPE
jgi:hypothetical protein